MQISFFGAAGEVTGSCYLVETDRARVLVDFGMHQGSAQTERKNLRMPPLGVERLSAVVLTHAHLDHCGRLPLLAMGGYEGPIYCTPATSELAEIILKDSAGIQEQDAQRLSRKRARAGKAPVAPLYGRSDVPPVLAQMRLVNYDERKELAPGVSIRMLDAGHILGSASVEMTIREGGDERVIAFSGDVGEPGAPLIRDAVPFEKADVLVMESTYGDRDHRPREETHAEFLGVLRAAAQTGGKVLIPAFAVGRTQSLIYHLGSMTRAKELSGAIVYVDSPMATETTALYRRHRECMDDASWDLINSGHAPLTFPGLHFTRSIDDSIRLNAMDGGVVVIAASGMCTGGRILHHLRHSLWRPETHVVFVGYQAQGSLGRRIVDGAKVVKVMGEPLAVRAQIHTVGGFSAHAGQTGLVRWASAIKGKPPRLFLTHGEEGPRHALGKRLAKDMGWSAEYPQWGTKADL